MVGGAELKSSELLGVLRGQPILILGVQGLWLCCLPFIPTCVTPDLLAPGWFEALSPLVCPAGLGLPSTRATSGGSAAGGLSGKVPAPRLREPGRRKSAVQAPGAGQCGAGGCDPV